MNIIPGNKATASYALTESSCDAFFQSLCKRFDIWAPQRYSGRGRFSDTDSIGYGLVQSIRQIVFDEKSHFSPKEAVFPISETLFNLVEDEFRQPIEKAPKDLLLVARACDINAIERLDDIFLRNGQMPDPYYQARRERIRFLLLECSESFDNCFCVSMNTNKTDNYAGAIRRVDGRYFLQICDDDIGTHLPDDAVTSDFVPSFIEENRETIVPPDRETLGCVPQI